MGTNAFGNSSFTGRLGRSGLSGLRVDRRALTLASVDDLNRLPRARLVRPLVARSRRVVRDLDPLDGLREWALGPVDLPTSPGRCALVLRVASSPRTDAEGARSLGVVLSAKGIIVLERANNLSVDDPVELLFGPVDTVGVELLDIVDLGFCPAVEAGRVAFAEVVGLDSAGDSAEPLPIDLVKIGRSQHDRGDDTSAWCSLHADLDFAEEKVTLSAEDGHMFRVANSELNTFANVIGCVVLHTPVLNVPSLDGILAFLEIGLEGCRDGRVVRAGLVDCGVALGRKLGAGEGCESARRNEESRTHRD